MANLDDQDLASVDVASPPLKRSRLSSALHRMLRLVALGYLTVCGTLVVMETRFVYPGAYMSSGGRADPAERSGIQQVDYQSADGTPLSGCLLHRSDAEHTILFLHGNGTQAIWLDGWLQQLSKTLNATVMAAEYRGYADDNVTPREADVIADGQAARDFLCRRYGLSKRDVILYGKSLGGGIAVALAAEGDAKLVILERTFDRLVDVAAGRFPMIPVQWLMRNRYDSVERVAQYRGPLIQVHGNADQIIPIDHARRLHDSASCQPKYWLEVAGMGHNDRLPWSTLVEIADLIQSLSDSAASDVTDEHSIELFSLRTSGQLVKQDGSRDGHIQAVDAQLHGNRDAIAP